MNKALIMSDSYFSSYENLDRKERKIIRKTMQNLIEYHKGNGFQVHKLDRTNCDDSFRSARCNRDLRIIFSEQGDKVILLYVDHHDKAYKWAEGKFLNIDDFGTLVLYNSSIEYKTKYENNVLQFPNNTEKSLLKKRGLKIKDLVKLGIESVHAEYLYEIKDEDKFLDFITVFPEEIQEALLDLLAGTKTLTEVYSELMDPSVGNDKTLDNALNHKNSKRRFYVVEDMEQLDRILEGDFEKWKLFLHPKQKEIVEKNYNGPVVIQGGPGTGKTVVALHRAVYLSKNIYRADEGRKILMCTFSKKLAGYIESKLNMLLKQESVENNIQVLSVDSLLFDLCNRYNLTNRNLDTNNKVRDIFRGVYNSTNPEKPLLFYQIEYKEVIQKYNITSEKEYLRVQRTGLGKALQPATRKSIWRFFEVVLSRVEEEKIMDFEDQAYIVYNAIKNKVIPPLFDSIIVDEAQDLSPVKLKVLYSLVKTNSNNLMILNDPNQTIYQLISWRKDVEIDIVGRSYYLDLNYRTTKQIKEYADDQFIYSEQDKDHIKSYKSILSGPEPEVYEFNDIKKQYDFAINKIKEWLDQDINPYEIGVILHSKTAVDNFSGILTYKGILNTVLEGIVYPQEGNGVGVVSVHGCKGLEFRVILLINYTKVDWDVDYENSMDWYNQLKLRQIECQKYVATTRAREELVATFML